MHPSCREDFKFQPIRNKNCPWWPCFLSHQNEMRNLYRGSSSYFLPSFGSFCEVVSRKIFRNQPTRNKNCLWWPCLITDREWNEQSLWGSSMDASYRVSIHLAKRLQRRKFKSEKLTDDRGQVMAKAQKFRCAKKDKQWSTKHYTETKDQATVAPLKKCEMKAITLNEGWTVSWMRERLYRLILFPNPIHKCIYEYKLQYA